jgi:hypothetical protein
MVSHHVQFYYCVTLRTDILRKFNSADVFAATTAVDVKLKSLPTYCASTTASRHASKGSGCAHPHVLNSSPAPTNPPCSPCDTAHPPASASTSAFRRASMRSSRSASMPAYSCYASRHAAGEAHILQPNAVPSIKQHQAQNTTMECVLQVWLRCIQSRLCR